MVYNKLYSMNFHFNYLLKFIVQTVNFHFNHLLKFVQTVQQFAICS